MSTTVRISETYDLSTKANRIGLLGIHTPPRALLDVHYGGLATNHRKVRFLGCDVVLACAATLPLDPLGLGTTTGTVNPADAMNPILYRAVSNDSFETLISRMYGGTDIAPSTAGGSLRRMEWLGAHNSENEPTSFSTYAEASESGDWSTYYGILSTDSGWRKAMPQAGVVMKDLVPLAYPLLMQYGNENLPQGNDPRQVPVMGVVRPNQQTGYVDDFPNTSNSTAARYFRGAAVRQPAFPLHSGLTGGQTSPSAVNSKDSDTTLPTTFVGAIIVPPCHTNGQKLYYRLRITWTIRYEEPISMKEYQSIFGGWQAAGNATHWSDYSQAASKLSEDKQSMVDSNGLDVEKVMEGSK